MDVVKTIKKEIRERITQAEGLYSLIGTELKQRRLKQSKTLSSVADELCSVSYLSKVENNKITPNKFYLKELCTRLDFSQEKMQTLFNLKEIIREAVVAFISNDKEKLKSIVEQGRDITTCRYKIVLFISYIMNKEYDKARKISYEILRLIGSVTDYDVKAYAVFESIFLFYTQELDDALDTLEFIEKTDLPVELRFLTLKYKYFSYVTINSPSAIFEYDKLTEYLVKIGYLNYLDELRYIMCLYLIQNKEIKRYSDILKIINNEQYKKTLYLLSKIIYSPNIKYKFEWLEGVTPFFYYLGLVKFDKKKITAEIEMLNDLSFDVDFNPLFLKYLILDNDLDKYKFISNIAIPMIRRYNAGYAKDFFLNELSTICNRFTKYKLFNITYQQLKGTK
ncbi:MAG: helix-turn-helix domain-containing protein [Erysipelotrichaceae bacterium]|nr:helix-turn-helix domain-containing protein [Erysipelotrichaceae bacterium]